MGKLENKQTFQVINIINTLIDATEHLSKLIKQKELNQSIFIFSSIVDGVTAIEKALATLQSRKEKLDKTLLLIAQELEKNNFIKTSEIIQFSLMPQLRKWKRIFDEENTNISNQDITIGIYFSNESPKEIYPEARIHALMEEGERQGVDLLFFSSSDINLETKQITGEVFENGSWQKTSKPFPNVVHNMSISSRAQQSPAEIKLRNEVPFTNFGLGNKFYLPEHLVKNREYADLLVPFKIVTNEAIVYNFLNENGNAILKPIMGSQGLNIYFVEKKKNHYSILEGKNKQIIGQKKFKEWIHNILLKQKYSYIIQHYIEARTNDGEPFDIRSHVQKNNEGKWQITKIYPRIGNKKSILSNISQGGRTEDLETFLVKEFQNKGKQYLVDLKQLSINLTLHLDKLFGLALSDLGIDLTIDKSGRFWLHEVNNDPGSIHHEKERAINTIGYAIYLARNGIYLTNEFQKSTKLKGQFNSRTTDLPREDLGNSLCIGMLVSENDIDNLTVACAYVAKYEEKHFYYFTPKDIDYDEMLIRGYFYENREWVPKVVGYPDVIYDRLRLRGIKGHNTVYEELEDIPFSNEFFGNSISKLEVYDKLLASGMLNDVIIPYQKVTQIKNILNYIHQYGSIILKPEVGSFAQGVHFISKLDTNKYFIAERDNEKYYNEFSLTNYLRHLINKGSFLVQKYIETRTKEGNPFDIRVHMMKNGAGEWSIVESYPRVGVQHATILIARKGGYMSKLPGFIERNFGKKNSQNIISEIESLSLKIAPVFEKLYSENMGELALDLAIDKEANLHLIEVNVNKPGINYYEFEVAKHAISYSIYIAEFYNENS